MVFQQRDGDIWDKVIRGKLANYVGLWRVVVVTNEIPREVWMGAHQGQPGAWHVQMRSSYVSGCEVEWQKGRPDLKEGDGGWYLRSTERWN